MSGERPRLVYYEVLQYQPESLALLTRLFDVVRRPSPAEPGDALSDAEALLAPLGFRCDQATMERAPRLKVIGSNTTGHPHIDVAAAASRGIAVVTLKSEREFLERITPTAELTFGLIVALTRNLISASEAARAGRWDRRPFGAPRMLSRMSLGVVGFGRLGRKVARLGRAAGMRVAFYDPFVEDGTGESVSEPGVARMAALKDLAAASDVLTIHVPHEARTEGLVDRAVLGALPDGAFVVNTARGEVLDHAALLEGLLSGRIAGAALDVFDGEFEPDFAQRLLAHPLFQYARGRSNVILTPHIGGSTRDAWRETEIRTIERMARVFSPEGAPS